MTTRPPDKPAAPAVREPEEPSLYLARMTHIQRIAGLGCWEWDPEANTLWWSAEVFRLLGQKKGRLKPSYEGFLSLLHPGDREVVDARVREALAQRLPLDIEYRIVRPDGRLRFIRTQGELVSLGTGRSTVMLGTLQDITEGKASEQRILQLAYSDALTGLPNRRMFQDRLGQSLAAAGRDGHRVGVMFLDLDHFKDVNDTLGHEFGDKLLRAVAQRLAASTREADTLARLGGDEFVVILTHLDEMEGVAVVAERIQASFRTPFELEGRQIYCGASIGIAIYPEDGKDVASMLQSADMAMYHAKGQGSQTYHFYSREMNRSIRQKIALENGLRQAIGRQEFHLVFQPQWDLLSGTLIGLEALIRWESAEFGHVPPASFLPLAESSGLIFPIGEWVLRGACTQAATWLADGYAVPRVAINISGHQLKRPDFLAMVDTVLQETGIQAQQLEFEFTENVLMEESARTSAILRQLKTRGIHLSIDDFGTGNSSLNYLRQFSVDRIKIDRTFVAALAGNGEDGGLVEAIIAVGRSLKLKVMAEGVESSEQLEFLTRRGCDEAQGLFFARPLPAEALPAVLVSGRLSQWSGCVDEVFGGASATGSLADSRS
jgi:diguanylate cyclase (GGDEF)-like protein/PAS domain S-box-containing protein